MATLGQQLRELRLQRGLTPDEISHETHIPARVIRDLEDDDYTRFDSLIYIKSFLTNYSKFLGWDLRPLLEDLTTQADITHAEGIFRGTHTPLADTEAPKPVRERRMPIMLAPICVALLGFVSYCLYAVGTKSTLPFQPAALTQTTPSAKKTASLPATASPAPVVGTAQPALAEDGATRAFPISTSNEEKEEVGHPLADFDLQASSSLVIELPEIEMAGQPTDLLP